ncbi:MAG: phosphate-binding protein [Candidatus Altiarchaeales archaeon A3]|nr:MAG: phosphate-binding protein [Candidatus Altiarchaeales archaeon A3]
MDAKNKKNGFLWLSVFGLIAVLVISGCTENPPGGVETKELSGALTVSGSTTVLPIAQQAADAFMDKYSEVNIQVSGGGSGVGVQSAGTKTADIGLSSRELKDSEKKDYPDLVSYPIAKDGIAIIVNPKNTLSSLTEDQIKKIYEGTYTNWKDLGGNDREIVVVSRDTASGTREFFLEHIMKKGNLTKKALEKNANGAVQQTVAQTPGAIGYVGLGYIDATVKAIKIDKNGVLTEPTVKNILDGKYPISRDLYMITNGPAAGLEKEFIDFIISDEGQKIVEKERFVPLLA